MQDINTFNGSRGARIKMIKTLFKAARLLMMAWIVSLTVSNVAHAQTAQERIGRVAVVGNERIEASTIATYLSVRIGDPFDPALIDQSLKTLFATGLFADVVIEKDKSTLLIRVTENPIINRVLFEGNSRLKRDDLLEEVQLRPRMIYTRARVRADVQRIIELYRTKGRFAAIVDPKIIQLDQNRVNLIFEISEGPKSRISRVSFIGNKVYSDKELRSEMITKESRWWKILTSNDTYDPDRLAYDRELLRQFYLQRGHADFRVVSSVAELTQDQKDFFITMVMEEGDIYKFGKVDVISDIAELRPSFMKNFVAMTEGGIYNAKLIESTIESMTSIAGMVGYAFLDVSPQINRNREERTLDITFKINEAPRTYVERINVTGNVRTLDKVIRREFRLAEGDAFNSGHVQRSETRLNQLGFFKAVELEQVQGSGPDKVILDVTVEEQPTGEMELGGGFSSLDNFFVSFSIAERNLFGKGQSMRLSVMLSGRQKQTQLSFTEPYLFGSNIAGGIDLFRTEYDSRNESGFSTTSIGTSLRAGLRISEYIQMGVRYSLREDEVNVGGFIVSPFILASVGTYINSSVGYTLAYDSVDNYMYPSRGHRVTFGQDFAGLGGDIKYLRTNTKYDYYKSLWGGFIFHLGAEAAYIDGLGDNVRLNDRFFLGGPKMRGFGTVGLGPRDIRTGDYLGGNIMYVGSAGFNIPMGNAAKEMGLRISTFIDVGSLSAPDMPLFDINGNPLDNSGLFDNGSPRVSVGVGVSWDSPFGPFRIDLAKAIVKQPWDKTEFLQFNVGTTF
jgi:outer membrane protein insertion porin family